MKNYNLEPIDIAPEVWNKLKNTEALNVVKSDVVGVYKYIHRPAGDLFLERIVAVPEKERGMFSFTYSYMIECVNKKWTKPQRIKCGSDSVIWRV